MTQAKASPVKTLLGRLGGPLLNPIIRPLTGLTIKQHRELAFWKRHLKNIQDWYEGRLNPYGNTPSPAAADKVPAPNPKDGAILSWHKFHAEPNYLTDLELTADAFRGKRLLDVGAGPIPPGTCFRDCELYSLDNLYPVYLQAGFPLHYYGPVRFVQSRSEQMALPDAFFDAIISVNAIDHVDDFEKTAAEIGRVVKPDALFRMIVHYHASSVTEPQHLTDERFAAAFSWCKGLRRLPPGPQAKTRELHPDEALALWSNF
jgi:SAM-dependent methyltransferase